MRISNHIPRLISRRSIICRCSAAEPFKQLRQLHQAACSFEQSQVTQAQPEAPNPEPFRKRLKDEAKRKRLENAQKAAKKSKAEEERVKKWELTVGIEVHAELNVARKLFSDAATSIDAPPNTHVALFDAAFPGTQPVFQKETVIPALRAALALNCSIQRISSFDRKHYFYQDQPAGYQITQYYGTVVNPIYHRL